MSIVHDYLDANQERFVAELFEYLQHASISTQSERKQELLACVEWLVAHCRSIGLTARAVETSGNPVVLAQTPYRPGKRPHFVLYGHYDVQPPDPLSEWVSPPFSPVIENGFIRARGASDNKGQHFAHLKALEAYLHTGTELPCDITIMIEGEEEVGSHSLPTFLAAHKAELACSALVISDTTIPAINLPGITCALRGLVSAEIHVIGPNRDLHSGIYGGAVENPAMVLCQLLARCRDEIGDVLIPSFNDTVRELSSEEQADLARLGGDETAFCQKLGVTGTLGLPTLNVPMKTTAKPTFEVNGLAAGYAGEGIKTIIPSSAVAKISMRLVADQHPKTAFNALENYLRSLCPANVRLEIAAGFLAAPYSLDSTNPYLSAAISALRVAFIIPVLNDHKSLSGSPRVDS
jgi:acetylornithine deacetylase/succinyl-diaminopimelate desuccinylase-like protein